MASRMITAEIELIIKTLRWAAAHPHPGTSSLDISPESLHDIRWNKLIQTAQSQRVLGFVAFALEQNGLLNHLAPEHRTTLTQGLLSAQLQNQLKLNTFIEYQRLFHQENIPVAPLKGIALSYRLYQDMPFRVMGDIDLLVRERDLDKIQTFLSQRGFALKQELTKNRWHDLIRGQNQLPFGKISGGRQSFEKNGIDFDFHWNPVYRISGQNIDIDIEHAWQRAIPVTKSQGPSLHLGDSDLAWHLILHTAEFGNESSYLIQLLDMAKFMQQWSSETQFELQRRIETLPQASRTVIETLVKDSNMLLRSGSRGSMMSGVAPQKLLSFFLNRVESDIYKLPRLHTTAPRLKEKFLLLAGYLLPNPIYYGLHHNKKGPSMYLAHWKNLLLNTGKKIHRNVFRQ